MKCIKIACDKEHDLRVNWPSEEFPTYFCNEHANELHKRIKSLREWMAIVHRAKGITKRSGWRR